jgi:hypothetical protein
MAADLTTLWPEAIEVCRHQPSGGSSPRPLFDFSPDWLPAQKKQSPDRVIGAESNR